MNIFHDVPLDQRWVTTDEQLSGKSKYYKCYFLTILNYLKKKDCHIVKLNEKKLLFKHVSKSV